MTPRSLKQFKLVLLTGVAMCGLTAGPALAQSEMTAPTPEKEAEEIVVTGVRASLARSIDQKRAAVNVVDGISAEDIADFPDLNISESLQRVTGVSITRNLGEGQQVTVRGLAPELTRVTINGQTVTSGNPGREVDFDIFASELFSNVQLAKTPTASMTEGGLAATIDLRTARPFDFKGDEPTFAVSGQLSRNQMRDKTDPRITALISDTFADGKVGVLASVSYSESSLRQDNAEGLRFLLTSFDLDGNGSKETTGVEIPFIPRYLLELLDRERLGTTAAIQLRPTDNFDVNLDVAYATFDEVRTRYSIDGLLSASANPVGQPTIDSTRLVTRATYNNVSSRSENILTPSQEDLLLTNLDTAWRFADTWEFRTKFGYSKSTKEDREFRSVWQAFDRFTYDLSDRIFVSLEPQNTDFTDPQDFSANQSRYFNTDVSDRDYSAQADITKSFPDSFIESIQVGVRYNSGRKQQERFDGRVTFATGAIRPSSAIATSLPVDDFFSQYDNASIERTWFVVDFDAVFADPVLNPSSFVVPKAFIDSFDITEKTWAGYIQANIDGDLLGMPIRGNFGLRAIDTSQTSRGFLANGTPLSRSQSYSEILPSLNLVGELSEEFLVRLAASKSLTRPTLTALAPGGTIAPTGLTARLGNPELDPFTALQLDVSLEWYFMDEALASATFFYKDVDGFITQVVTQGQVNAGTLINDLGQDVSNAIFTITKPINGDSATVKGFELSLQLPFTFLPSPLDGFGALVNYTYADSSSQITFNNQIIKTLLPGQSRSSYNIIGYYEKGAFSTRLAYSWRDDFLQEVRASSSERSNFQKRYGQLDANIQYAVTDYLTVTFDVLNILEAEAQRYAEREDRNIVFSETGRFFMLGARARF